MGGRERANEREMSTSVAYVTQQLTGPVPLDTADEVQSLMKKEADDADRYANHSHHQPAVPVQPVNHNFVTSSRLLLNLRC